VPAASAERARDLRRIIVEVDPFLGLFREQTRRRDTSMSPEVMKTRKSWWSREVYVVRRRPGKSRAGVDD
jgi:hypothetical protein